MFLFSNRDRIQEIISFLYSNPTADALKTQLNQTELTETELQQLVDFIHTNPTSTYSLTLAHALFDTVKFAFRNTQLLYIIMEHALTDGQEKKFCAEKLIKRLEKLKNHPAYQIHQSEYLLFEAMSYKVLGEARFVEGYPVGALPYYRNGLDIALQAPMPELAENFELLMDEASKKIRDDESLSKSLTNVIEGLKAEIDIKQKELASLLQIETIQSIQEKIEEVERLASQIEQRQLEMDQLGKQIEEAHQEIQISRTRVELLTVKTAEFEQRKVDLSRINDEILAQQQMLDVLNQQVVENKYHLEELEKAKSDTQVINDAIAQRVDQLSAVDRQLDERKSTLAALDIQERSLRAQVEDLIQQESGLQQVVAQMDDKIQKTIDYTYRQKALDDEQMRVAVNIEKQNSVVSSLNRTIGDLNAAIGVLKSEVDLLKAQKTALLEEMRQISSPDPSDPSETQTG